MIRTFLIYLGVLAVGITILVKALLVQTREGDELRALAEQVETRFDTLWASRGDILACDGSLLATDVPIFEVGIDPSIVNDSLYYADLDQLCRQLAEMFPNRSFTFWKNGLTTAKASGRQYFKICPNATLGQCLQMKTFPILRERRGGFCQSQPKFKRNHPYGTLAERTIGYVTEDRLVGLESACDSILRGSNGRHRQRKIHHGTWIPIEDENNVDAVNGNDVVTTIDIGIQDIAERALRNAIIDNVAEQGCAIVMEVATGEVKAITNLQRDRETNRCAENFNFALGVGIEPGSTFKLASMLVLLNAHPELDVNRRNVNIGRAHTPLVFSGKSMYDDHPVNEDGLVTIREVFEQSSNKGTARLITDYFGDNPEQYINGLYSLGLNLPMETGMLGEATPFIKHPVLNRALWSKTSLPWMSIGYELRLAPLQILTLYNAVANGGRMMKPQFIREIRKEGVTLRTFEPVVVNEQIASPSVIDTLRSMMKGVVTRGTAKGLRDTEYGIAGKTGTAQLYNVARRAYKWINAEGRWERDYNVTFVGFFPADNPVYSCIVVISKAKGRFYSAGKVAAPAFKEIADRVYATKIKGLVETAPQTERDAEYRFDPNPMLYGTTCVPDVRGMSVSDAVYLLENMGWNTHFEGYGQVARQSVPAGDSLVPGGLINLILENQ